MPRTLVRSSLALLLSTAERLSPFNNTWGGKSARSAVGPVGGRKRGTAAARQLLVLKSDSRIGPENFHSDKSQNNVMIGPYDSP